MTVHQPINVSDSTFDGTALSAFGAAFPDKVVKLSHQLAGHPLLHREALALLADRMPTSSVEYNLGTLPLGLRPEDTPHNGLSVGETVRTIADNGSWVVLKNVEQDAEYAALLDHALAPLLPVVARETGPMLNREAFIFVTSPGSVTPFHMDPEHNILLQIEGEKTMTVFPARDAELVPPEKSEAFHGGGHRNLVWHDAFLAKGVPVVLNAGDAIHVPVKAPHFVRNGDAVSVSFSITWRSTRSVAEGELHALNARLRGRGLPVVGVGVRPEKQLIARTLFRVARRLNL